MATALRLQACGASTAVFEAHGHVGGCAGYWRHRRFSFDVGATTLVDFEPVFLVRLWIWAFHRARRVDRAWLGLEGSAPFLALAGGLLFSRGLLLYAVLALVGSWVYPLLTVYLPHHGYGDEPLQQTRTLRGRIIPAVFLELTYHLEHHLYPQVPSHHLPELARRLDPHFARAGVRPVAVP